MASKSRTVSKSRTTEKNLAEKVAIDASLLERCLAGDRNSQHQLYELSHRRIYGLMVRMVGLQDAMDATQQVYLQMFRKIDQFKGGSKFETWLYRLAINEALQYLRKGRRWEFQTLSVDPVSNHQPEEEQNEHKELLDIALSKIDPELRSIFVTREVEGLSYREIAEVLDIPEGTVGSRLNRARRELQQHLSDLGWEP